MLRKQATPARFAGLSRLAPRRFWRVAILLAVSGVCSTSARAADIFDATADYSITNNPNGVWSSGYKSTLSSGFVVYGDKIFVVNQYSSWTSNAINPGDNTPSFFKNLRSTTVYGLAPNQIALHGGSNNQYSILRFTAPKSASYYLQLQFFAGDSGDTDGYAILNDNSANPLFYASTTNNDPTFNSILNLSGGDFVDIVVGTKGGYQNDTTPITVVFTEQAVPEPQSVMLGLFAAGVMATIGRRRNRAATGGVNQKDA